MNYEEYKTYLTKNFKEYTDNYDSSSTKINLKIIHTYKVAALCEEIARSLNLSDDDIHIAWTCGMLHDIGRFEQVKRYNTFVDSLSVDHANFGADLLFVDGLYNKMVQSDITPDQKDLIEKAIRAHSSLRIPENLRDREKLFANLLRDADKLDIFRVNKETPLNEIFNRTMDEIKASEVSEEVMNAFNEKRCVKRDERHTAIDFLVAHICLVFELVYPKSLELMKENKYLDHLLNFESVNENTQKWFAYMREEIQKLY